MPQRRNAGHTIDITMKIEFFGLALLMAACASTSTSEIAGGGFYQDVSWSPDSKRIAYSRMRDNAWSVFVAKRDGSDERRVSPEGTNATWTAWSPDGRQLAYASGSKGQVDIFAVPLFPSGPARNITADGQSNSAPSWSPDGKKIVFASRRSGKSHLYIIDAEGTHLRALTAGDANDWNPQWSSDGQRILFYSDRLGKNDVVCTIAPDGSNETVLTSPTVPAIYPGWSDRQSIVFAQEGKIMLLSAEGGITPLNRDGFFARIAPNSRWIAIIEGKYPTSRISISPLPQNYFSAPKS